MSFPKNFTDILQDALTVIENKVGRTDEATVRLAAVRGDEEAQKKVAQWDVEDGISPLVLHDQMGNELKTIEEVAAANHMTEPEAANAILDDTTTTENPTLRLDAQRYVKDPSWGETACIMLIPENPDDIAVPWGDSEDSMHLTMAYFPETDLYKMSQSTFFDFVGDQMLFPIEAELNGYTVFFNDAKKHAVVLNVDSVTVEDFRAGLAQQMKDRGIEWTRTHGYTPHMTLGYIGAGEPLPPFPRVAKKVRFTRLRASYGSTEREYAIRDAGKFGEKQRLVLLEEKSLRRHVRTPEGARHYGQPIGSLIAPDALPERIQRSKGGFTDGLLTLRMGGHVAYVRKVAGDYMINFHDTKRGRDTAGSWFRVDNDEQAEQRAIALMRGHWDEQPDIVETKKSVAGEVSEGIYGRDWVWGGERALNKNASNAARREYARRESEDIGITIYDGRSTIDGKRLVLGVDSHEVVNLVHRGYVTDWPNFNELLSTYYVTDEQVNGDRQYIAYNETIPGTNREVDRIGLAAHLWQHPEQMQTMEMFALDGQRTGFKANNVESIAEEFGVTIGQAGMMRTLHHEIGHTLARTFLSQRVGNDNERTASMIHAAQGFRGDFDRLLQEFGIPKTSDLGHRGWATYVVPFAQQHVSGYAAHNFHEFFSEVWASYMLDRAKTDFVNEMGNYMDYWFTEYLKGI